MLKFTLTKAAPGLRLPDPLLKLAGLEETERLEAHALTGTLVLLPARMTALELIRAADALQETASRLLTALAQRCGPCDGCLEDAEKCTAAGFDSGTAVQAPAWALDEAGIPQKAKLVCCVSEQGVIRLTQADHAHDLSDVPEHLMEAFREAGICMEALEELLMEEADVYGGGQ